MSIKQITDEILGKVFNDKVYSKIGINTKNHYNHLRRSDQGYVKPTTPVEYKRMILRQQRRARSIEEGSINDTDGNNTNPGTAEEVKVDLKHIKNAQQTPEKHHQQNVSINTA